MRHMRELAAALSAAGVCIVSAGCGGGSGQEGTSPATSSTASSAQAAPASTTPSPLAEAALDGLLLSPAQIDTALGATGLKVVATKSSMADDITVPPDAPPDKIACVGIAGTAETQAYAGSGFTAVRDQALLSPGNGGTPASAGQSVVLFDSADQAAAFLDASAQRWSACRQFSLGAITSTVGEVSNSGGVLSTTVTQKMESGATGVCERALAVANNVATDVSTCGGASGSAVAIAKQIAAKISN